MFKKVIIHSEKFNQFFSTYKQLEIEKKDHQKETKKKLIKLARSVGFWLDENPIEALEFLAQKKFPGCSEITAIKEKIVDGIFSQELVLDLAIRALKKQNGINTKVLSEKVQNEIAQSGDPKYREFQTLIKYPTVQKLLDDFFEGREKREIKEAAEQKEVVGNKSIHLSNFYKYALFVFALPASIVLAILLVLTLDQNKNSEKVDEPDLSNSKLEKVSYKKKSHYVANKQGEAVAGGWKRKKVKSYDVFCSEQILSVPIVWGHTLGDIYWQVNKRIEQNWNYKRVFATSKELAKFCGIDTTKPESQWLYHKGVLYIYKEDIAEKIKQISVPEIQPIP